MTEARSIREPERQPAARTEQLAHARPAVERWLTWSGLLPLPAFLALHLLRELKLAFATDIADVVRPAPSLFVVVTSVLLVWLPLGVHVVLALARWLAGRRPPTLAHDVPRVARQLSQLSGWLALAFLAYHGHAFALTVWLGQAAAEDAGFRLLAELSGSTAGVPLKASAYLLGLLATAAHAGLGVHRGLLTDGWLESDRKRRTSARACAVFGAALFCVGAAAVIRVASGVLLR
jgi:succinate dehydrogenase / fumarate reductase, cytochrome b subunit